LFLEVRNLIPAHIGVFTDRGVFVKRAKRKALEADETILKDSLIRSLCRDARITMRNRRVDTISRLTEDVQKLRTKNSDLSWENQRLKAQIKVTAVERMDGV
jgi:uncharacterized protein YwgA